MPELVVRHLDVPSPRASRALHGLRIAHVSDLHLSRWTPMVEELQRLLIARPADFVAVTGDFCRVPRDYRRAAALTTRLLAPVAARRPVYAVLGNHDHECLRDALAPVLTMLPDRSTVHRTHGGRIRIGGVEQLRPGAGDIQAALADDDDLPTVLLAHYPSTVYALAGRRVDIQLSGHTHGGQVRLPRLGCIWSNDRLPARCAWGLTRVGRTALHVSAGIGVSPPIRIRWNCPPEVTFLRIVPPESTAAAHDGTGDVENPNRRVDPRRRSA